MNRLRLRFLIVLSCTVFVGLQFLAKRPECAFDPLLEFRSPDQKARAVVLVESCEHRFARPTTEIAILAEDETFPRWFAPDIFFAATDFTQDIWKQLSKSPSRDVISIDVVWLGPKSLMVRMPAGVHVFKHDTSLPGGYDVKYEPISAGDFARSGAGEIVKEQPRTFDFRVDSSLMTFDIFTWLQTATAVVVAGLLAMRLTRLGSRGYGALLGLYTLLFIPAHVLAPYLWKLPYAAFVYSNKLPGTDFGFGLEILFDGVLGYLAGLVILAVVCALSLNRRANSTSS